MTMVLDKITNFLCRIKISKKALSVIFIILFVLSLIPIIITAFYSVPTYDDYNFGYYTHKSVVEGTSFIGAVLDTMSAFYNDWQGFFSANILASIQLFNIDVNLYFISNLVAIFISIVSLFYFSKVVLRDVMKCSVVDYILISVPVVFTYVQFLPSIAEGFYWMDGSLGLCINSLMLFIFGFIVKYYLAVNRKQKIIYFVLSVVFLLVFFGCSLQTFIVFEMLLTVILIYSFVKKLPIKKLIITLMAIYIIGIIIALVAPGNSVRYTGKEGYPFVSSILYAIFYSLDKFGSWTNLAHIAVIFFISVIFYPIAQKSKYSFKKPLFIFIILYAAYAAMMAVQLFAAGYLAAPRQMNLYYRMYLLMLMGSSLYFTGWLSKRKEIGITVDKTKMSIITLILVFCVFICGCLNYGVKNMSTVSTAVSLYSGETQTYNKETKERISLYNNEQINDVEVHHISSIPKCFVSEPLTDDISYWTNKSVARYYGKDSVKLVD